MNEADPLSDVLRSVTLTGALFLSAELRAPWGFAAPAASTVGHLLAPGTEHLVLFHLVIDGEAKVRVSGQQDLTLAPGDIVVLPRGDAHELWSGPRGAFTDSSSLLPRILGGELASERGGGDGPLTEFVCGYIGCERYAERLFLAGLPAAFKVHVRGDASGAWIESAIRHLASESSAQLPGRRALLAKLAEALFIDVLRRFMAELPPERTGWLAAARDPAVGRALAHLHRDPAHPWTLAELARRAGVSRSVLAEHFRRLIGEPPLAYLARWRVQLGARLLRTTDHQVLRIALDVGYRSEAAFNRAFKRELGLPPARYRRGTR